MSKREFGERKPSGRFVGLCTVDVEYVVSTFPQPNRKCAAASQELTAGGPAANAAVTFSFLGGSASLTTVLGCHPVGTIASQDLKNHGVDLEDVAPNHPQPPPFSSVFVHSLTGERTVVSANSGASKGLKYAFNPNCLFGADILLIDGHHMPLCLAAARQARGMGIPVVLDGGSWKEGMPDLLAFVDIAICSEDFTVPQSQGSQDAARYLRGLGVSHLAITRGSKPTIWESPQRAGEIAVPQIQPRDTLGAGDIFHGAFCWAFAGGHEYPDALAYASDVASHKCLYYGTRSWMNSFDRSRQLGEVVRARR